MRRAPPEPRDFEVVVCHLFVGRRKAVELSVARADVAPKVLVVVVEEEVSAL